VTWQAPKAVATGSVIIRISLSLNNLRTSAGAVGKRISSGKPRISNARPSARDRNKPAVRSAADQNNSVRSRTNNVALSRNAKIRSRGGPSSVALSRNAEIRSRGVPRISVGERRIPGV